MAKPLSTSISQSNAPNFEGRSQGVAPTGTRTTVQKGKSSTDTFLSNATDLIGSATFVGNQIIEGDIQERLENEVTPLRESLQEDLKSQSATFEETTKRSETVPSELKKNERKLKILTKGFESGSVSASSYWGQVNAKISELKVRHPGYKEYINKQVTQLTGADPQNALESSLRADIASRVRATTAKQNRTEAWFNRNDKYISPALRNSFDKGEVPIGVVKDRVTIQKQQEFRVDKALRKQTFTKNDQTISKFKREESERKTINSVNNHASQIASNWAHTFNDGVPNGGSTTIAKTFDDIVKQHRANTLPPEKFLQFQENWSVYKGQVHSAILQKLSHPKFSFMSVAQKQEAANQATQPYEALMGAIQAKDVTLVEHYANTLKYRQEFDDAQFQDNNKGVRAFRVLQDVFGDDKFKNLMDLASKDTSGKTSLALVQFRDRIGGIVANALVDTKTEKKTKPGTQEPIVKEIQKNPEEAAEVFNNIYDIAIDPTIAPEIQGNVLRMFYDTKNNNLLGEVKDSDKIGVFKKLTSPEAMKAVLKASANDRDIIPQTMVWAKNSFRETMKPHLFNLEEAVKSNKFFLTEFDPEIFQIVPKVRKKVNSNITNPILGGLESMAALFNSVGLGTSINEVNNMITQLIHVADGLGQDRETYIRDAMSHIDLYAKDEGTGTSRGVAALKAMVLESFESIDKTISP